MFRNKTVDGVLASFSKTVEDLQDIAEREAQNAASCRQVADDALLCANAADAESERAANAAIKISALLT